MLLDTAIFIDYLKGDDRALTAVLRARTAGVVPMHAIVAAELIAGVLNRSELRRTLALISTCSLTIPDDSDVRRALKLLQKHTLADGADWNDCLIAATAARLDQPVITLNVKHFRVFRGVQVARPY